MGKKHWREWLLVAVTGCGVAIALSVAPIPQDEAYHQFADQRTVGGIPHCWNVLSNLAFVGVGIFGLSKQADLGSSSLDSAYRVFSIGMVSVGLGSAYYHYEPTTRTLAWDRLPMTVAFMALFSMALQNHLSEKWGRFLLWPLLLVGVASVGYWHESELAGRGDLRAYLLIQFLPMLLIPLLLLTSPSKGSPDTWLWGSLGMYVLAKITEYFDTAIYHTTGFVSGHTLKHFLAALAALWVVFAARRWERQEG
jgi:hypothetical protein